eukprot:1393475-Amorphochlora_amoeboformis.AAC.1
MERVIERVIERGCKHETREKRGKLFVLRSSFSLILGFIFRQRGQSERDGERVWNEEEIEIEIEIEIEEIEDVIQELEIEIEKLGEIEIEIEGEIEIEIEIEEIEIESVIEMILRVGLVIEVKMEKTNVKKTTRNKNGVVERLQQRKSDKGAYPTTSGLSLAIGTR